MTNQQDNNESAAIDQAVSEGGAYDVIRKRLLEQGAVLKSKSQALNQARLEEFGNSDMAVAARIRVRTENNCIPRDIVQVGPLLLFGYNVFIGLKTETHVEDVFALFHLQGEGENQNMEEVSLNDTFLQDTGFVNDFNELYRYYKNTKLVELTVKNGKLLAGFQIGERLEDIRVFRWAVSPDGKDISYIDNRGERDIALPEPYDFEWIKTTREDVTHGRHAHVNILNTVFVDTTGGDLTIKIENNTEDGKGIYREPVEDKTQSLDDAEFQYAELGSVILIKVLPYREDQWRYLVFNTLTESVLRIDAIGSSCVQLPEDHGIVFPGGYYLQSGEYKTFDEVDWDLKFKRMIRSPNGEDVLYVFYDVESGVVGLFAYNMIKKSLQNPIYADGYALAENGTLVLFDAQEEPSRIHPMQVWSTPFVSEVFASNTPPSQTFLGKIGNAELVRGISDLFSICRIVENQSVSAKLYEELRKTALKVFDDYYWIKDESLDNIESAVKSVVETADLAIDEFEKVESIRRQSKQVLQEASQEQEELLRQIRVANWEDAQEYVDALDVIRKQRGHLTTIAEYRYIDTQKIEEMDVVLVELQGDLSEKTVTFLSQDNALKPYSDRISAYEVEIQETQTVAEIQPIVQGIESVAAALDLLSELLSTLKVSDATVRTKIIDSISEIYAKLNQTKANAKHKQKSFGSAEAVAQFSAQFKLFSQSITNALGLSNTPEACDEQMSRLLIQLEELESQFADYDEFLSDIVSKRDEVYESFESHKQYLLDERQRKAQSIADAAERILSSIERRSNKFTEADELNTYFASDALVMKVREFVKQLNELDAAVKADDIESRFKGIKDQALRVLRDKSDIYEGGGQVIKLGPRHRFSVNTQDLDLTIIPREDNLCVHLTGTNYFEIIDDEELNQLKPYWQVTLDSESAEVYRAEYLAGSILRDAELGANNLSEEVLHNALLDDEALGKVVREYAAPRYKEGYEKGIHDHDAALILKSLVPAIQRAELLRYDPMSRGFAQVFWANIESVSFKLKKSRLSYETWVERSQSAIQMHESFGDNVALDLVAGEIRTAMEEFLLHHPIPVTTLHIHRAADYLVAELGRDQAEFVCSKYAYELADELRRTLDDHTWRRYQISLEKMLGWPAERWNLSIAWINALIRDKSLTEYARYAPEAAALINSDQRIDRRRTEVDLELTVSGLMGDHPKINNRSLKFSVDEFLQAIEKHRQEFIPNYHRFLDIRQNVMAREKKALRLESFKARPLSSFVRNKLINEAYLPIIGDNLAKQMGTVGENKRTDLMGLLMMISPPGYGKTTLMEYVASRLGLIFMKINCPSLGHDVLSLDPEQAPNATARQELEKLNLALEMGNNVMLYLDDIQHTHPEFLQKFISLCDGTRRIEGVWKGNTKTYDMRGRKFCVVMAGNPYTESGEVFKIPDMLANRADIYNLGEILGGMDEAFALSYIENSLTSNAVLAPLATREQEDVYRLIRLAKGDSIPTTDLSHPYSAAEINEITDVLKKLFVIQDVVLKINQQYIASAAQADKYRVEPPFKLQGSYRNMNKMAEKVSAIMNESELQQMLADHYLGEAQLLTSGAEENLLKLAELRGVLSEDESARWEHIKADFARSKALGGDDSDTGTKVVNQLMNVSSSLEGLGDLAKTLSDLQRSDTESRREREEQYLELERERAVKAEEHDHAKERTQQKVILAAVKRLQDALAEHRPNVEVVNQPVPGLDKLLARFTEAIEVSLLPLVHSMEKKLEIDLRTHHRMDDIAEQLQAIEFSVKKGKATAAIPPKSNKGSE